MSKSRTNQDKQSTNIQDRLDWGNDEVPRPPEENLKWSETDHMTKMPHNG